MNEIAGFAKALMKELRNGQASSIEVFEYDLGQNLGVFLPF